jgi:hypothetical protein
MCHPSWGNQKKWILMFS